MDLSGPDIQIRRETSRGSVISTYGNATDNFVKLLKQADVTRVNLRKSILAGQDLSGVNLAEADLRETNFYKANLHGANLSKADLRFSYLGETDLSYAQLDEANIIEANLTGTNLNHANLRDAYLVGSTLLGTNLSNANLTGCFIYGISAWDVRLDEARQFGLIITLPNQPQISVDNLEVAQFVYLLLNNQKIRQTIDTITSHTVLILGRFTPDRKAVVDTLSEELRTHKYLPIVFNLEEAAGKDIKETMRTLSNLARFVLIDLAGLGDTIRDVADDIVPICAVPIQPLFFLGEHQQKYELFRELQRKYRWVLAPYHYKDLADLQSGFQEKIIQPIDKKIIELQQKKPLKIFMGYAPNDKSVLNRLKTHLKPLERAGLIELWDDQDLTPGGEKGKEIEKQLSDAQIILLLVSPDFLTSYDCYDIQTNRAMELYMQGEAIVIPIILRPCNWQLTSFKKLQPLPRDGKPVSTYSNKDDVLLEVSKEIAGVIKSLK